MDGTVGAEVDYRSIPDLPGSTGHPPTVHDPPLPGAGAAVVGGQPEHHPGDVVGLETVREALRPGPVGVRLRGEPVLELTLGHDPPGEDAVDADAVGAVVAGQRTGHAFDRGLGGHVGGE